MRAFRRCHLAREPSAAKLCSSTSFCCLPKSAFSRGWVLIVCRLLGMLANSSNAGLESRCRACCETRVATFRAPWLLHCPPMTAKVEKQAIASPFYTRYPYCTARRRRKRHAWCSTSLRTLQKVDINSDWFLPMQLHVCNFVQLLPSQ